MPGSIKALCNQIVGEAKAISEGSGDVADLRASLAAEGGDGSQVVAHLENLSLQHLENLQQLVILLTSTMTATMPKEEGENGGGEGEK
ncbi:hypothetical protein AALA82_01095 [Oscillospiraceae bacterium 50-16]